MGKYINPLTDYGWKVIFGQEANKPILISLLNSFLEGEIEIVDIVFLDKEQLPDLPDERMFVYDIYCRTSTGEYIIVEIQRASQKHFRNRALVYTASAIVKQALKGEWDYKLDTVYGIFFLDFRLPENEDEGPIVHVDMTTRKTHRVFNTRQRQIFISLPTFELQEDECVTNADRWIYVLKNMEKLNRIPFIDDIPVMRKLQKTIALTSMDPNQRALYEASIEAYRDNKAVIMYHYEQGLEEGEAKAEAKAEAKIAKAEAKAEKAEAKAEKAEAQRAQDKLRSAKRLKACGVSIEIIMQVYDLPRSVIEQL
jgi:predicted transposase/invertase (TIGR01784 family)